MIWLIILAFFIGGWMGVIIMACFAHSSYKRGYDDGFRLMYDDYMSHHEPSLHKYGKEADN